MPLQYDDEPGSWGRMSEGWPQIQFSSTRLHDEAWRYCVKDNAVPYGSYVSMTYKGMNLIIRFETEEYKKKVVDHMLAWAGINV